LLSRTRLFFQGVVFVDDRDFAVVQTYGKLVGEIAGSGTKLPFTLFETFRENVQGRYWLPTYMRSDDYITDPDGSQTHLRLVVRSTDFKLNPSPSPPAAPRPDGRVPHPSRLLRRVGNLLDD
jgi:hypothetical protein